MVTDSRATDRLPSLPQVLLRILEAIQNDQADFQQLAAILHQDAAMMSRLLNVANSSFYSRGHACQTLERALFVLGTDTVRTIVITAAIKQYFNHFSQGHRRFLQGFWRRSLLSANLAQVLAHLTRYGQPEEAYLCGLLMDMGQLQLLTLHGDRYCELAADTAGDRELLAMEQRNFATTHSEAGADLIDAWRLSSFLGDAVRYHHEPASEVKDAHHLVKIVNLASALSASQPLEDHALDVADQLFGLTESLTRELQQRIGDDVERLAGSLGIDIDTDEAEQRLGQQLGDLAQLNQISGALLQPQAADFHEAPDRQLQQSVQRAVYMTLGIEHCLLFTCDAQGGRLSAHSADQDQPVFELPLAPGRSLISDAVLERRPTRSDDHGDGAALAVIDRQLQRLCGGTVLVCLPLLDEDRPVGALAMGMSEAQLPMLQQRASLVGALGRELAQTLVRHSQRLPADADPESDTQLRIREAVHEAGNPLSIIRNYLEMLRLKLGEQHDAHQDLELIKTEIDRVGHILLRLQEPGESDAETGCDASQVLKQTARIFECSILSARGIALKVELDPRPTNLRLRGSHLKQIITNLLKNAAEVLPEGGVIRMQSEAEISVNGHSYVQITVTDNGPGIPEHIKQQLFQPVSSTKGGSHGGLGLSIVKRLMEENGGTIICKSSDTGTQFQLLLPTTR